MAAFSDPEKNIRQFAIGNNWHVADFGVGSGAYTVAAARAVSPDGHVYAIDVRQNLLARVKHEAERAHLPNVSVIHGDLEVPGGSQLDDRSMDAAVVSNILFEIEDKRGFVREVKRVLRPRGKALVVEWRDSFGGLGPTPRQVVSPEALKALFAEAGFAFEREIVPGAHHYGFIFRRAD
ncbi:MAG: methyltransferase domain-containing protein [Parcubacteria group bacterium]|nr:methyltransferase domain-containing protein [Parcubacteria group bacterium]